MNKLFPAILFPAILAFATLPTPAEPLSIVFDSSTVTVSEGGTASYSGTITNTTSLADVYLNFDGFTLAGFDTSTIDDSPFFTNANPFLGITGEPSATTMDIALFNIPIPNPFAAGDYNGTFEILGGATPNDMTLIGSASFTIDVTGSGTQTPEPSTFVLFVCGVLGLAASAGRRRVCC